MAGLDYDRYPYPYPFSLRGLHAESRWWRYMMGRLAAIADTSLVYYYQRRQVKPQLKN